jgi:6-pyruvoyltetrahydropterin/6-carboxytetrahydropterin synthase
MWELIKSFRFEAAHSLAATSLGKASEEIHGHSFRAEVVIRGAPDPATGMLLDLTALEKKLEEIRAKLDHKLLNKVDGLNLPTLENISRFVWEHLVDIGELARVSVYRDSCGEACNYYGPKAHG